MSRPAPTSPIPINCGWTIVPRIWLISTASASKIKAGGALLSADRKTVIGSLLIFEGEDEAEIEAMLAQDPYAQAGLFASVDIKPWRQAVGVPLS